MSPRVEFYPPALSVFLFFQVFRSFVSFNLLCLLVFRLFQSFELFSLFYLLFFQVCLTFQSLSLSDVQSSDFWVFTLLCFSLVIHVIYWVFWSLACFGLLSKDLIFRAFYLLASLVISANTLKLGLLVFQVIWVFWSFFRKPSY